MADEDKSLTPPYPSAQMDTIVNQLEGISSSSNAGEKTVRGSIAEGIWQSGSESGRQKESDATQNENKNVVKNVHCVPSASGVNKAKRMLKAMGTQKMYQNEKQSKRSNESSGRHDTPSPTTAHQKRQHQQKDEYRRNGISAAKAESYLSPSNESTAHSKITNNIDERSNIFITSAKATASLEALKVAYGDGEEQFEDSADSDKRKENMKHELPFHQHLLSSPYSIAHDSRIRDAKKHSNDSRANEKADRRSDNWSNVNARGGRRHFDDVDSRKSRDRSKFSTSRRDSKRNSAFNSFQKKPLLLLHDHR